MTEDTTPDFTKHKNSADRVVALASDLAGMIGAGAMVGQAIKEAIERRRAAARESLIEAIAGGDEEFNTAAVEQIDEFAGIALRYMRAAEEGIRKRNLRLLAKVIVRSVVDRGANAEVFSQKAAAIEGLTDDELQLLAEWFATDPDDNLHAISEALSYTEDRYNEARTSAAAMMRLGLVEPISTWGGMGYSLTPAAKRILDELRPEELSA